MDKAAHPFCANLRHLRDSFFLSLITLMNADYSWKKRHTLSAQICVICVRVFFLADRIIL